LSRRRRPVLRRQGPHTPRPHPRDTPHPRRCRRKDTEPIPVLTDHGFDLCSFQSFWPTNEAVTRCQYSVSARSPGRINVEGGEQPFAAFANDGANRAQRRGSAVALSADGTKFG
jgi:hypothetical protein